MSLFWRIMAATQRNEEVRTQVSSIYKRTTHILEDTREEERSIHRQIEMESTHRLERAETDKSGHQRKRATEGHAPTGERRGRVKSGRSKKANKRITHVLESAEGVENQDSEKRKLQRDTHSLGNADEGIGQESEGKRASEGHSRTEECRGWDKSGTANKSERARGTHFLEGAGGGQVRIEKGERASDGHSLPGERRQRDKLG